MRNAVLAGVAFSALLAFANVILALAAFIPSSREGFWVQYLLVPFLYLAGLVSLALLGQLRHLAGSPGEARRRRGAWVAELPCRGSRRHSP